MLVHELLSYQARDKDIGAPISLDVFNLSENSKRATFVENLKAHFTKGFNYDILVMT